MKPWAPLMAIVLAGCVDRTAPAAQHPEPEQRAQPEPAAQAEILVEVVKGRILIDGVEVKPEALTLQTVLMNRSTLKTKLVVRSEATEADRAALVIAVREAVQTIAQKIELSLGELRLTLRSPFEMPSKGYTWMVMAGPKALSLSSRGDSVKVVAGDAASEANARAMVDRQCGSAECWADVTLSHDASLIPTLLTWQRVYGDHPMTVLVDLPSPDGVPLIAGPADAAEGTKKGLGRLPPEVIQRTVRQTFENFRHCYELGLRKNARLAGKMRVRFVIGMDGKVASVQDFGSNMPDLEVRECVLQEFKGLSFPKPEGGVVTVVYPIMLAPD